MEQRTVVNALSRQRELGKVLVHLNLQALSPSDSEIVLVGVAIPGQRCLPLVRDHNGTYKRQQRCRSPMHWPLDGSQRQWCAELPSPFVPVIGSVLNRCHHLVAVGRWSDGRPRVCCVDGQMPEGAPPSLVSRTKEAVSRIGIGVERLAGDIDLP